VIVSFKSIGSNIDELSIEKRSKPSVVHAAHARPIF